MMASLLIVFREVLEAALIVGIIAAVTKGVPGRSKYVSGGIAAGVLGAVVVALFADQIANMAEGLGQEIFNAGVLFAAVGLLSWHNVWMAKHGKEIADHVGKVGREVKEGSAPLYALATVISVAVLREGSEIVLFLYGIAASGGGGSEMALGSALGLAAGAALGVVLYLGLLRIPLRYFFTATSWMILLLAAGMAGNAANFLAQADVLPSLGNALWDTSWLLSEQSVLGQILHVLIGYSARPSGIQVWFYLATIVSVGALMIATQRGLKQGAKKAAKIARKGAFAFLILGFGIVSHPGTAKAGPDKIYSPNVVKGELELENRGFIDENNEAHFKFEAGYGITENWASSIIFEGEKEPGEPFVAESVAWENIIQLTEQGQYFVDVGIYLEYEKTLEDAHPDKFEGKILLEKATGRVITTANLVFGNQIGTNSFPGTEFEIAWQSRYLYKPEFEFGIQAFHEFGQIGHFGPFSGQQHRIGPAIFGTFKLGKKTFFKYEGAYLIGMNKGTTNGFRWLVEFEGYF